MYDDSATFRCAFCGDVNVVDVDISGDPRQSYVEDCQVCCRPNLLRVRFDPDGTARVDSEPES